MCRDVVTSCDRCMYEMSWHVVRSCHVCAITPLQGPYNAIISVSVQSLFSCLFMFLISVSNVCLSCLSSMFAKVCFSSLSPVFATVRFSFISVKSHLCARWPSPILNFGCHVVIEKSCICAWLSKTQGSRFSACARFSRHAGIIEQCRAWWQYALLVLRVGQVRDSVSAVGAEQRLRCPSALGAVQADMSEHPRSSPMDVQGFEEFDAQRPRRWTAAPRA